MAYYIQVKDDLGNLVRIKPGGTAERQIGADIAERLKGMGVGFFKTEATVLQAVEQAVNDVFRKLKSDIIP